MSFEEEFDRIIRRKAEEEHYPFDQNHWDNASRLIEADRKALQATRLKKLVIPSVVAVVLVTSAFIAYNYFDTKTVTHEIAEVKALIPSAEQTALPEREAVQGRSADNVSTVNSASNSDLNITHTEASVASDVPGLRSEPALAEPVTAPVAKTEPPSGETQREASKLPEGTSAKDLPESNTYSQAASSRVDNTNREPESADLNSASTSNEQNPISENATTSDPGRIQESGNTLNSTVAEQIMAEELNAVYSTLPYEMTDVELMEVPFTYLDRYDDYYSKKSKTHYMNVELGGNYLMGWDAKNGKDGQGLNWYAGINYGFYLCNKVSLGIGIQAYNIAHINQPFYLVASKDYNFGSTSIYTQVTSNQLYYVGAPLRINYAINKTNVIGIGFNAAYLVAAHNSITKYYVLDNEKIKVTPDVTNNEEIYKGTSMMNMMLSAHYKTRFGKRIGLNLEFNYGLTDLFENTGDIKTVEKPMGARLGVTYTLFDK